MEPANMWNSLLLLAFLKTSATSFGFMPIKATETLSRNVYINMILLFIWKKKR